jgi:hypothetical protein
MLLHFIRNDYMFDVSVIARYKAISRSKLLIIWVLPIQIVGEVRFLFVIYFSNLG